ncbi:class I SAM-dependent methyltransferase [Actinospongicola halichondriae]|uniref:class I SAM-dependent methyltransferase n=1 Tax=Actinospongicola halichondriae TaxID=3236844 RepID=UPI003D550CB2
MTGSPTWAEPWAVHEDEHVLVVAKPAGVNTHRADVHAQDGMYEWVQRQRPDVALSIVHRLDKVTSGVLVFGKTAVANRSLTRQFEERTVAKAYDLVTTRDDPPASAQTAQPIDGAAASTAFERRATGAVHHRYVATPHSGRTHQVRIHAEALGLPITGDVGHGGREAPRVYLHAGSIAFDHPEGGRRTYEVAAPPSFDDLVAGRGSPLGPAARFAAAHESRAALFDPADTDAYLWVDRDHDGFADLRIERLGRVALVLDYRDAEPDLPSGWIDGLHDTLDLDAVYVQHRPRGGGGGIARRVSGEAGPTFDVSESGVRYRIDLSASPTSSGLFLDQRETRREILRTDLTGTTVLNTFAHTGALSVAAALAGAETLTLDLSKHYLDWARENLRGNDIDPAAHDFIYGDAMEWMTRLAKKGRTFDLVLVDPPTSSTARKGSKRWTVGRDLHDLVTRAAMLCAPGGRVYVSTNFRKMQWPAFLDHVARGLDAAGRVGEVDTRTLPLDHRSGPGDPPYLKGAWIRLDG